MASKGDKNSLASFNVPSGFGPLAEFGVKSDIEDLQNEIRIKIQVADYDPAEISITSRDNTIVIEGKHEEKKDDNNFQCRHFKREYVLPINVNFDQMKANRTPDGLLIITAPKTAGPAMTNKAE
uniref:SHSP domain-containing protein n=1 Tax=Romanomermis culicivorax TaxID=13658 RepID=A0A915HM07_ROMCU